MSISNSKKSLLRFGFNMVEVALAMLVISLGLSTVLVLFPAGMKASRQAEEENLLIEAAEAMEAYIRMNYNDSSKLPDVLAHDSTDGTADTVVESKFSPTSSTNKNSSVIRLNNSTAHAFLYRKLTEADGQTVTEFSCVVRLLRADLDKGIGPDLQNKSTLGYFPAASSSNATGLNGASDVYFKEVVSSGNTDGKVAYVKSGTTTDTLDYLQVIDMEISYPADKPYSARKKRVYRLEIFDENYHAKGLELP